MILQDAFQEYGYVDLLAGYDPSRSEKMAAEYGFHPEDFFDVDERPEELIGIFISMQRDELFFLLHGNSVEINTLCDEWDNRIRVFTIMNGRSKMVQKLKYNIVQLIVYSGDKPDDRKEANLRMSRKIIIKGDLTNKNRIEISDGEAVELPFYVISADDFEQDQEQKQELDQLLPKDGELLSIMKAPRERVNRRRGMQELPKHYSAQDFDKIKEWLET